MCQSSERPRGSYIWSVALWREHRHHFTVLLYNQPLWVDARRLRQAGVHPFMSKPRPRVSYQSDHPLQSDRHRQAAAGHSQPAAACRDAAANCCRLYTKTPSTSSAARSLGGGGRRRIFIQSVVTEIPNVAHQSEQEAWDDCLSPAQARGSNSAGFGLALSDVIMSLTLIDFVSADQQNALKVVRASKPRTRKSSKVTNLFFLLFYKLQKFLKNIRCLHLLPTIICTVDWFLDESICWLSLKCLVLSSTHRYKKKKHI